MPRAKPRSSKPAQLLEKQLERYRSMRDFQVTAEPRGGTPGKKSKTTSEFPFVIQKHDATRLHYDFRLAWDGVLKSWAVTKGPSLYPGDKRLAVQVEDHPIEYGSFEGTIPKGQYGGGTVMVWDYGTWKPLVDVERGFAKGDLKFELNGTKLKGSWVLARMRSRDERPGKPNWLLIKHHDEFAQSETDPAITDEAPDSAVSGRTVEQIATDNDRTWQSNRAQSNRAEDQAPATRTPPKTVKPRPMPVRLPSLNNIPDEEFPGFIPPQLAQHAISPPAGGGWIHELKLDGYRIQIHVRKDGKNGNDHTKVKLLTRKGLDWTARMPEIVRASKELGVQSAILDGEVVVLDESGKSNFDRMQASFQGGPGVHQTYFAFDLLHLNGHNLRGLPLLQRKDLLARILSHADRDSVIQLCEHFNGNGTRVFEKACSLGAEGIVSKPASASYAPGRNAGWLKSKCGQEQEFVIGGFTDPSKDGPGLGAILIGYYEGGKLRYAGRSGTGFTELSQRELRRQLDQLSQTKPPFVEMPQGTSKGVHWVQPKLVAKIAFAAWTADNLLRQASFKGLREDKPASEVVREVAVASNEASSDAPSPASAKGRPRSSDSTGSRLSKLPITHPEKVLDETSGMTKRMLAEYYMSVADHMLPHIAERPLSVVRCPEGIGKPCFFQKHIGIGMPEGIKTIPVPDLKTGESEDYLTVDSAQGLVGLAQMGVLEIHPWGARNDSLEKPDRIVFDLDPDAEIDWRTLAGTAALVRERLMAFGLESFVKTTGGKGLHVVAPIRAEHAWPAVKEFTHSLVLKMEKQSPDLFVTKMTKSIRKGRIFLDYLRNDRGATAVAPFSPRARPGASLALPLRWNELNSKTRPVASVADFATWKKRLRDDPWSGMNSIKQRLSASALRSG
jgi:bifunctional non-homologous end joining protein LigD